MYNQFEENPITVIDNDESITYPNIVALCADLMHYESENETNSFTLENGDKIEVRDNGSYSLSQTPTT